MGGAQVTKLMIPIKHLRVSDLYLLRDQSFPGRCVLALCDHCTEADELLEKQGADFFKDLQDAVSAIRSVYNPNKVNYAIFGDLVPHFHIHLVPKYKDKTLWGKPFSSEPITVVNLSDEEYTRNIASIETALQAKGWR